MPIAPTRRAALLGAAAAAALARTGTAADLKELEEAARREGQVTWYTAHTDGETAQLAAEGFMRQYPGIKVGTSRLTAQVAYERLRQDLRNGVPPCDVFSTTDVGHNEALKSEGRLARLQPVNAAGLLPEFQGMDPDGTYFTTLAELVLPIHNTAKVPPDRAPKDWRDLLDPRWRGQVGTGHPAFSGTVGLWVLGMRKLYGWSYFEELERNRPLVGRSVNDTVTMLNSGERSVAAGPSALSLLNRERGNPIGVAYPPGGAVLVVSPSAVLANAPHPNAARLYLEYLLGPVHAQLMTSVHRGSIRADTPPRAGDKAVGEIPLLRLTTPEIVKGIPEVIEQWRDTFAT